MVWMTDARAPEGSRIYAVGDVHGCHAKLATVHRLIAQDISERPVDDWRIIHVGDYVDRGPDSCQVLDLLIEASRDARVISLLGNHDHMMLGALRGDKRLEMTWMANGAAETLASYPSGPGGAAQVPEAHLEFLASLPLSAAYGDYLFVHAGVDPRAPDRVDDARTLLWIRDPFLDSTEDLGAVVVHGHTPMPDIDLRPNRIGIDTGAVFGGPLTCLVLEGAGKSVLTPAGVVPLY